MYLMVGLGNPGQAYAHTRHNIGFQVIGILSRELGIRLSRRRFQSRYVETVFQGKKTIFLCPETFMNLSGVAVKACANFYKADPARVLVVHDDLDLPVGRVKLAGGGGPGGHKGVASIIRSLGTRDFPRVRIGIGRPRHGEPIEDFVLAPFYRDQQDSINRAIQGAVQACELFVLKGVESAMNVIHCQNFAD